MMTSSFIALRRWYCADFIPMIGVLMFLWVAPLELHAQRNSWTSEDVRPLTKLPWLGAEVRTLDAVLDEIFHEPNMEIRYAMLHAYLSMIPAVQLGEAYEKCIVLEGSQTPDQLVELLLCIWGRRDPRACWEKAKTLFDLVGIEHGFLGYDSYVDRDKITVQNREAIRASRYWIEERAALLGFTIGLEQSSLSEEERVRLMKECAEMWFARFKTWPDERLNYRYSERQLYSRGEPSSILRAFEYTPDEIRQHNLSARDAEAEAMTEIVLRRWLKQDPQSAIQILEKVAVQQKEHLAYMKAEIEAGRMPDGQASGYSLSREWLLLWRTHDSEAMLQWARTVTSIANPTVLAARGMFLSRVDARTRNEWLKAAKDADKNGQVFGDLLGEWSIWDFKSAMGAALIEKAEEAWWPSLIQHRATHGFEPTNLRHVNLGFVRDFDVAVLQQRFEDGYLYDWATESMECWGRIDVGEAARYGVLGLMKLHYYPQSDLIKFFKGENNEFSDTGDMIDRTFCCLRVWAVVRPDEMKAWIPSIQDPAMRDALTYILEHPWGTGEASDN